MNSPRTALLTSGVGPIARVTFEKLFESSSLRCVVFSRRDRGVSRFARVGEYGIAYTLQHLISVATRIAGGYRIHDGDLEAPIESAEWRERQDEPKILSLLQEQGVEAVFACELQHILSADFISNFQYCLNIHPSYLPAYRGPEPVMWGLLDRQQMFGITLHMIDRRVDAGDIVSQASVRRPRLPLRSSVEMKLAREVPALIDMALEQIRRGSLVITPQGEGFYLPAPTLRNRAKRKTGEL